MKTDEHAHDIYLGESAAVCELKVPPAVPGIFLKAMWLSFFKSNRLLPGCEIKKHRLTISHFIPDPVCVQKYCRVCNFDRQAPDTLPVPFIQTLFIKLLGKYITASFFPFNPLGLIQIYQSMEWHRPVRTGEEMDLSCELSSIQKTSKGYLSDFLLSVRCGEDIVWEGVSRYLSKIKTEKQNKKKRKEPIDLLEKQETITVPADTGRQYAAASGDYNPHHLYSFLARVFGFKSAIAHGMWSMARSMASLNRSFNMSDRGKVEAAFKLPIFLPAVVALGYEKKTMDKAYPQNIAFELRDNQSDRPHLKGQLYLKK